MFKNCLLSVTVLSVIILVPAGCKSESSIEAAVYTRSSAIEEHARAVSTSEDWIYDFDTGHSRIYARVTGVRGVFSDLRFLGEGEGGGDWILLDGQSESFDLSALKELVVIPDAHIPDSGTYNTIIMGIKYLELDISFKGQADTIRIIWRGDDAGGEEKSGDILFKDSDGQFKWITYDTRTLSETRPAEANVVKLNNFVVWGFGDTEDRELENFVIDNFSNDSYMISPPPWSGLTEDPGRLDNFLVLSEETAGSSLEITMDLCFENSATFINYLNIGDPAESDAYDSSQTHHDAFFTASADDLKDLQNNSYDSEEFNLLDILPALIYPEVYIHAETEVRSVRQLQL